MLTVFIPNRQIMNVFIYFFMHFHFNNFSIMNFITSMTPRKKGEVKERSQVGHTFVHMWPIFL